MTKNISINPYIPIRIGYATLLALSIFLCAIFWESLKPFNYHSNSLFADSIIFSSFTLFRVALLSSIVVSSLALVSSFPQSKILGFRNKFAFMTLPTNAYACLLIILKLALMFALYESVSLAAYTTAQIAELSSSFTPLPNYQHERHTLNIIQITIAISLSLVVFTKPKEKVNTGYLMGLFALPVLVSLCMPEIFVQLFNMIDRDAVQIPHLSEYETLIFGVKTGVLGILSIFFTTWFLIVIPACYAYISFKAGSIKPFVLWTILGFAASILVTITSLFIICASDTSKLVLNNYNIESIELNGHTYHYDLSLIKHPENDYDTEFLLESYAGISMHNSTEVFNYLVSANNTGDKELAIKFIAKIHLRNFQLFALHREAFLKAAESSMTSADYMRGVIGLIIYENSSLEMIEPTLQAVINRQYQLAIDLYISDIANANRDTKSSYNGEPIKGGSGGTLYLQAIIRAIVQSELATLDLNEIKDERIRDFVTENLKEVGSRKTISDEQVNEWYRMFGIID
ncbi:hypothetical protein LMH73_017055 [Vibrio splendidus]|nr:hypothetical protein [Vibrio splendidus]MCC4880540.1 hypothetical protein [Vibrio splendidus]